MKLYACLFFLILFTRLIYAVAPYPETSIPSGDNNYYIHETKDYRVIFDQQYLTHIDLINKKIKHYLNEIHNAQNVEPREPINIILLSAKNQKSNALATLFPFTQINIFPSGVESPHHFWLDSALVHELNHIYQMSHSHITPLFLSKVSKLPLFLFFFTPYPNISLPSLFIEGDAVFKESMFQIGGRLYESSVRALVYAQIKKYRNRIDDLAEILTNTMLRPHSRIGHYNHGGYLFTALEKHFSYQKVNEFFKRNAIRNTFLTITFNHALMDTFNMDIAELTQFYIQQYDKQAYLQRTSSRPSLFTSAVCEPFNRSGNKLFFLTSDHKSPPYLRIYDSRLKKWVNKKVDLPIGKIFKIGKKYYSRASTLIQPFIQSYSLFSEGIYPNPSFNSKYVQDMLQGRILYTDASNTLLTYKLYLDDQFYDNIHSNALFDPQHNVYYFKQKGKVRTLYKNQKPVFSYQGYDGRLVDIDRHGDIFFTAPTHYGSSVYRYSQGKVTRSSSSDTIIHGKKINNEEMLVCEVTAEGYDYKIIPIENKMETPAIYRYHFEKTSPFKPDSSHKTAATEITPQFSEQEPSLDAEFQETQLIDNIDDADLQQENRFLNSISSAQLKKPELLYKKYSPLSKIRFSNWTPISTDLQSAFSLNPWNMSFRSSVLFTDYLQKNYIKFAYEVHAILFHKVLLAYENLTHSLNWNVGYNTGFLAWDYNDLNHVFPEHIHTGYFSLTYPLLKKGRWFSSLRSTQSIVHGYYNKDHHILSLLKKAKQINCEYEECNLTKLKWIGSWNIGYTQKYPFAYSFQKGFVVNLLMEYDYILQFDKHNVSIRGDIQTAHHLGYEFYIIPKISYITALTADTYPARTSVFPAWDWDNNDPAPLANNTIDDLLMDLHPFSKSKMLFDAVSEFTTTLRIKKAFHTPIYFSNFPVSLVRIIPLMEVQYIFLESPKKALKADIDWSIGKLSPFLELIEFSMALEAELLFYYNRPVVITIPIGGLSVPIRWAPTGYPSFTPSIHFLVKVPY
ncbi:MAG: hypothetical protein OXK80_07025 [Bdellovibrionales bacterium]|nr:hypothetical protein [Bdellovibrionales bacterium]